MLELQASPTELSTAATDLLLGLGCAYAAWRLGRERRVFRRDTWLAVFLLLSSASVLGSLAHGLRLPFGLASAIWHPLYLALGLAVALVLVGALHDVLGEGVARRWRIPLLLLGVAAYAVTQALDGAFVVFLIYEGLTTLAALAIYVRLARSRPMPGATLIALGLLLNLVAAVVQASDLKLEVVFKLDHNGLFHIVLMPAFMLLFQGVMRGLQIATDRP
jgi:hypothetical protein